MRKGEENITHVIRKCEETINEITLEEFLSRNGKGGEVMKRIDRIKEEKRKEERDREEEHQIRTKKLIIKTK